jgi:hypothetical protein
MGILSIVKLGYCNYIKWDMYVGTLPINGDDPW